MIIASPFNFTNRFPLIILATLLALVIYLYFPSLDSSFYLDDFPNLENLEKFSNEKNLLSFIFDNGNSRPLSYLTFIPQYQAWIYNNPFPFKFTNLLIHIFNCLLLYIFSYQISKRINLNTVQSQYISCLTVLLWAIAPIHVNSILYTIQRMTLLSGSFILLSSVAYLLFDSASRKTHEWVLLLLLILAFYILGISCKENAILIGMQLGVIIYCFKGKNSIPAWWYILVIISPFFLTILYLFFTNKINYIGRDFDLTQRLITEPKILFDYIRKIIFSTPSDISLFYDNYPYFKKLNVPSSLYISGILFLIFIAIKIRNSFAIASFAVLWFMAGHLLESTIIPLELYFEHRNYIPSIGIYFFLAYICTISNIVRFPLIVLIALLAINAFYTTSKEVGIWKNTESFAINAVLDHPESTRALQIAAEYYLSIGDSYKASELIWHAHNQIKPYSSHLVSLTALKCLDERISLPDAREVNKNIGNIGYDLYLKDASHTLFQVLSDTPCQYFSWQDYIALMEVIRNLSPGNDKNFFHMHLIFAQQMTGNKNAIMKSIQSLDVNKGSIDQGFFKIYMLLEYDQIHEASLNLHLIEKRFENKKQLYIYRNEIQKLKMFIKQSNKSGINL